jgi:outer membrane protein
MQRRSWAWLLSILLGSAVPTAAYEDGLPSPEGLKERVRDGRLQLTVADAVRLTLLNDTQIRVSELQQDVQEHGIDRAQSAFDPTVTTSFTSSHATATSITRLAGAPTLETKDGRGQISLHRTFVTGTALNIGFDAGRSTTNSSFASINPSFSSGITFGLSQPLLRGFGTFPHRAPLLMAESSSRQSRASLTAQLSAAVARAINTYWEVVEARENLAVQRQSLELAEATHKQKQRELELGVLSPLDIYGSEQGVASRKLAVIGLEYNLKRAQDQLRTIIGADLDPEIRELPLELAESPAPEGELLEVDEAVAVARALERRPERVASREAAAMADINVRLSRDAVKPELSLNASYTYNGIAGTELDTRVSPPVVISYGGLGDALDQIRSRNFPNYSLSLQMTLPLRNRLAQAALADARIAQQQSRYTLRRQTQDITLEVRSALQQLTQSKLQMDAARFSRDIARKRLDAEQRKHELGLITVFFLLDAQNQLAEAEVALLHSQTSYQRAVTEVRRVTGDLLSQYDVQVR